jgi:hypothetical protein
VKAEEGKLLAAHEKERNKNRGLRTQSGPESAVCARERVLWELDIASVRHSDCLSLIEARRKAKGKYEGIWSLERLAGDIRTQEGTSLQTLLKAIFKRAGAMSSQEE